MTTKEFLETANEEMSRKVWEHYGKEVQKKKFIEELSELITALAKEDRRAIGEEMADVKVMIMQFENGMEIDTLPIMNYKLHRQLAREVVVINIKLLKLYRLFNAIANHHLYI